MIAIVALVLAGLAAALSLTTWLTVHATNGRLRVVLADLDLLLAAVKADHAARPTSLSESLVEVLQRARPRHSLQN